MAVTVVVGGQFGGEGKGKIVSYLSVRDNADYVVRCGGPNSGHTVDLGGKRYQLRLLPAGFVNSRCRLLLAAGALVNVNILLKEMELCGVDSSRLGIDYNTGIVSDDYASNEQELKLWEKIGSTQTGTGVAVVKRAIRDGSFRQAKDVPELRQFLTSVSTEVNEAVDRGLTVIVEGTQGFGLSLYHADCYPYATSRDTTASAFLSEVGLSPLVIQSVVMAIRTYPIRVGGNSGPLKGEITWEELRRRSGYPYDIMELTTVTQRERRVALFDLDVVKRAAMVNRPTEIALHGADYIEFANKGVQQFESLSKKTKDFVSWFERELSTPVTLIGTGPTNEEIVDRQRLTIGYRADAERSEEAQHV